MAQQQGSAGRTTLTQQIEAARARPPQPVQKTTGWGEVRAQGRAGLMGAADMIAFGKGKEAEAALIATKAMGGTAMALLKPQEFKALYGYILDRLKAQEEYDRKHRLAARRTGQVVGGVAMVVGAPEVAAARVLGAGARGGAAVAAGGRVARSRGTAPVLAGPGRLAAKSSAPRTILEKVGGTTVLAGGGGAAGGVVGEGAVQVLSGDFDAQKLGAAAVGGFADGLGTKYLGSSIGGGIGGAVDSMARGGGTPDDVWEAFAQGAALGRAGRHFGAEYVQGLTSHQKGQVGEQLSIFKSLATGQIPRDVHGRPVLRPVSDTRKYRADTRIGESIPDLKVGDDEFVEAKLGRWADTTKAQNALLDEGRYRMRVDHWMPIHVGNAAGVGLNSIIAPVLQFEDSAKIGPDASTWPVFNGWSGR